MVLPTSTATFVRCYAVVLTFNFTGASISRLIVLKTLQLYVPKELEKSILQQIAEINSQHTEAGLNEAYNIFLDILPIDLYQ